LLNLLHLLEVTMLESAKLALRRPYTFIIMPLLISSPPDW
jgi:hypothetical protein